MDRIVKDIHISVDGDSKLVVLDYGDGDTEVMYAEVAKIIYTLPMREEVIFSEKANKTLLDNMGLFKNGRHQKS